MTIETGEDPGEFEPGDFLAAMGSSLPTVRRLLEALGETAELRGYTLEYDDGVVEHLVAQWQPRFGVRQLTTILRHRIIEQLAIAEVHESSRASLGSGSRRCPARRPWPGSLLRKAEGDAMTVYVA